MRAVASWAVEPGTHHKYQPGEGCGVPGYMVEFTDGTNTVYLYDVGCSAGPVAVGALFVVTISPVKTVEECR
jgi:hypothetical protein